MRLAGIEPTTPWFVAKYSIQLSYSRETKILSVVAEFGNILHRCSYAKGNAEPRPDRRPLHYLIRELRKSLVYRPDNYLLVIFRTLPYLWYIAKYFFQTIMAAMTAQPPTNKTIMKRLMLPLAIVACSLSLSGAALAVSLDVEVTDAKGNALADAAVYVEALSGPAPSRAKTAEIEQKGRKFIPLTTVIQTGSEIAFPNNDTVRHHVYSFSPAKPFELKLYSGIPGHPVLFDKPGTVVIGCNIHDRMVAYIQVVNTPYFGKSDEAGKVRISDLPAGKYKLKVWHHQLLAGAAVPESEIMIGKQDISTGIALSPRTEGNSR